VAFPWRRESQFQARSNFRERLSAMTASTETVSAASWSLAALH
jgi:hypothetical protein